MNAAEIRLALEKLNVLGRVLYVAAHPDDENTGLISYFSNGALFDTAYLSLTRGDGGQNLIGAELGDALGVIRTQELLEARKIDRGEQFFTRAKDFGYSKSAEETLRLWDREKILADTVWVIRKFRPDVIVTRFPPDDDRTHGHHTASALLAQEAFRAAADPKRFPEQLTMEPARPRAAGAGAPPRRLAPWQATRILWNASTFFFRMRNVPFDPTGLIKLEAGGYQPLLGKSFPEIAAASRTMHKSQGFGAGIDRGERTEYFKFLEGKAVEGEDIFSGIDTTWARVPKSEKIAEQVRGLIEGYDVTQPSASVSALLELRKLLRADLRKQVPPEGRASARPYPVGDAEFLMNDKLQEIDRLIAACLGLHLEVVMEKPIAQPGEETAFQIEAINRSPVPVQLKSWRALESDESTPVGAALPPNELVTRKATIQLPPEHPTSHPYWLRAAGTIGTFDVADQTLIGQPQNAAAFPVEFTITVGGEELTYQVEPRFRRVDRVQGEVSERLVIAPPVFVDLPRPVFMFASTEPKRVEARVTAAADKFDGELTLEAPAGWKVEPATAQLKLATAGSEMQVTFQVTPPAQAGEGTLRAFTKVGTGERRSAFGRQRIDYPHIEPQILIPPAEAKLVRAEVNSTARRVGYIAGAGDAIPDGLREIGVEVKLLSDQEISAANLAQYDAVVLGIRAYNVHAARIGAWFPELMSYARNGGVVIVQYNTTPGPKPEHFPAPLQFSRDRVTDETAEVRLLVPDHPILNKPNKITAADFNGWVQERGLYFASEWDKVWTPILSSNDPGEKPADGGLLVTRVEKGWFIYTGYAWFRQLPAGVTGAHRLFANMISLDRVAD
ncbi:PIG-L family deacetylase [soil metagenome]